MVLQRACARPLQSLLPYFLELCDALSPVTKFGREPEWGANPARWQWPSLTAIVFVMVTFARQPHEQPCYVEAGAELLAKLLDLSLVGVDLELFVLGEIA